MLRGQAGGDATENMEDVRRSTGATEWSKPHVIVQDMYHSKHLPLDDRSEITKPLEVFRSPLLLIPAGPAG